MGNVTVIFRTYQRDEIQEIANKLGTTKSDLVRLCVLEGIRRIRTGEFRFTVLKEEATDARAH